MSGLAKTQEPITPKIPKAETIHRFIISRRGLLKGIYNLMGAAGAGTLFYGLYRFLAPGGGIAPPVEISLSEVSAGGTYSFQYGGSPGILIPEEDGSRGALSPLCPLMVSYCV